MNIAFCAVLVFALLAFATEARTKPIDDAYSAATKAFEICKNTWFKQRRIEAIDQISDAGVSIALNLNPLSRNASEDNDKLGKVTEMLKECGEITYGPYR